MTETKTIFLCLFVSLIFTTNIFGQIEILQTAKATDGCNGSVVGIAIGPAGPFEVALCNLNNDPKCNNTFIVITNDNWSFNNLCQGDYKISVSNNFDCAKDLFFTINGCDLEVEGVSYDACEGWFGNQPNSIEISVTGGDTPYFYMWNNGAFTQNLYNVSADTYTVTVTDISGCTQEQSFEIEDDGVFIVDVQENPITDFGDGSVEFYIECDDPPFTLNFAAQFFHFSESPANLTYPYSTAFSPTLSYLLWDSNRFCIYSGEVSLLDCSSSAVDPFDLQIRTSGSSTIPCNENLYTIDITILTGGIAPYQLRIDMLDSQYDPDWQYEQIIENPITNYQEKISINAPGGRIRVSIWDQCGRSISIVEDLCEYCGFTYVQEDDGDIEIGDGAYELDIDCSCFECGGPPYFENETEVHLDINSYSKIHRYELPITFYWPTGDITSIYWDPGSGIEVSEPSHFTINEAGPWPVTVVRADGCVIDIPLEFNEGGLPAMGFIEPTFELFGLSYNSNEVYFGSFSCLACVNISGEILDNAGPCLGSGIDFEPFHYVPNNWNNPCDGGGLIFTHFVNENGEISYNPVHIPPNVTLEQVYNNYYGDNLIPGQRCDEGGGACIFDSFDVYGFEIGKPILVQFCQIFEDWIDSDGDEIPDNADVCPGGNDNDDMDGDFIPDACDENDDSQGEIDSDSDGISNTIDNCPFVFNPDQLDSDGNGTGDACEEIEDPECVLDIDCPNGWECVNGTCIPECGTSGDCSDNQFCDNGECKDCPNFSISFTYGNNDDCNFEVYITSNIKVFAYVYVTQDGSVSLYEGYPRLGPTTWSIQLPVPNDNQPHDILIEVVFDNCVPTFLDFIAKCGPEGENFTENTNESYSFAQQLPHSILFDDQRVLDNIIYTRSNTDIDRISELIEIAPNPFSSILNINALSTIHSIKVFDALGMEIKTEKIKSGINNFSLDLSDHVNGVYILYIALDNGHRTTKKVIKM